MSHAAASQSPLIKERQEVRTNTKEPYLILREDPKPEWRATFSTGGQDGGKRMGFNFDQLKYRYLKNHKKTVKNGQVRTQESEECTKVGSRSWKKAHGMVNLYSFHFSKEVQNEPHHGLAKLANPVVRIRVRSFSDPTDVINSPIIKVDQGLRIEGTSN
ncbi:hypothetical protein Tco_1172413 [Tanacetum coccineum]